MYKEYKKEPGSKARFHHVFRMLILTQLIPSGFAAPDPEAWYYLPSFAQADRPGIWRNCPQRDGSCRDPWAMKAVRGPGEQWRITCGSAVIRLLRTGTGAAK